ncbi:hypothetical protein [Agrobacterium radiobacter]|uniref:hypothetical protein n=1 Tax=Agrobacterium radiobacter TaxID=362 RepID=UPI003CF500A2
MLSEVINRLRSAIEYAEADKAQDYADAETTGERVDLNNYDVSLSLEDAKALDAALSAAEPVENISASKSETLESRCTFGPDGGPKNENIEAFEVGAELGLGPSTTPYGYVLGGCTFIRNGSPLLTETIRSQSIPVFLGNPTNPPALS